MRQFGHGFTAIAAAIAMVSESRHAEIPIPAMMQQSDVTKPRLSRRVSQKKKRKKARRVR